MALIEVRDLTKIFSVGGEQVRALDGISLKIEAGEFVAVTGPSGSGKSTLMHVLGLLDKQSAGEYRLDGKSTADLSDNERARLRNQRIGFIFQSFYLLPRTTAWRNVTMPLVYAANYQAGFSREQARKLALAALERVGLGDRVLHKPNELSGGQRQRVAIARAVVNNPAIVFADEPTGNLDSVTGHEILKLFTQLNREGVTVVLVTHDPNVAAVARRRISTLDGRVQEDSYAH